MHWSEIVNENSDVYWKGRTELEKRGFVIRAFVVDGKKCLKSVFLDLHIQMCHFHQVAIITRYLTRRLRLEAGKELKKITSLLKNSNEKEFTILLNDWFKKWEEFFLNRGNCFLKQFPMFPKQIISKCP